VQPDPKLTAYYLEIYKRIGSILMTFPTELGPEGSYMLKRIQSGVLREAQGIHQQGSVR
jgi:hypothetical protein